MLSYKLHGSVRPISMKSDVIRKRSHHNARRVDGPIERTPWTIPGHSRRASPVNDNVATPTFAPDSWAAARLAHTHPACNRVYSRSHPRRACTRVHL
jgi:hypothetical protein